MNDGKGLTEDELRAILNQAPIGLMLINGEGDLISQNYKAVEIRNLINAAFNSNANNLFVVLQPLVPNFAEMVKTFPNDTGVVFSNKVVSFSLNNKGTNQTKYFYITATKQKGNSIIIGLDDITEQHRKEEAIMQAMLDKAVEQGKFEIASDVLHDIGNAVVGFGSYLTRIKRLSAKENTENLDKLHRFFESQKEAFVATIGEAKTDALISMVSVIAQSQKSTKKEIERSITEQLHIITHIQEILNIQRQYVTGHETAERKPVNIRSIINDCMAMLFASFDKRGIVVSLNIPDVQIFIKGDRTKLMQVILNILKNSIEAIPINQERKAVTVKLEKKQDNNIVLQVADTGEGFDAAIGEKLFTRGYTTKSSGTGLGLYNCKAIIESHSGTINITSEGPGKGSLVTIVFNG